MLVNFNKREPILIIFAQMLVRKQSFKRSFIFPRHPATTTFAPPGKHGNTNVASFSLTGCKCFDRLHVQLN